MDSTALSTILNITEIVFYFTLIILSVYLINFLKKFLNSISKIENEVIEISDQLSPIITDMKYVTEDLKILVDKSRIQFERIENISNSFIDKGKGLLNSIDKIQDTGNGLILNASNMASAIGKGFNMFRMKLLK